MPRNLTLSIDDDLLAKARVLAAMRRTSVNEMVRGFLRSLVDDEERVAEARRGMMELIGQSELRIEPGTDVKELSRSRDPDLLSRHEHPDQRGRGETA